MGQFLQFAFIGLSAGAVYAVLASSVVAAYIATGVINFAQGSLALWAVWTVAELRTGGDLVLPVGKITIEHGSMGMTWAIVLGVLSSTIWALLAHLLVFRPLRRAPELAQVVASIGIMIFLQALVTLRFDTTNLQAAPILPARTFHFAGAVVHLSDLILGGSAIVVALLLWAYFRFTRIGLATRAGAEDDRAARLMGYAPDRLAALIWGASGALCGLIGILAAPTIGLDPTSYTFYIVPALAAALVGRLKSIGLACAAGLLLGVFQSVVGFGATKSWWPGWAQAGTSDAVVFLIVIIALFVFGGRIPARGGLGGQRLPEVIVPRLRVVPITVVVGGAVAAILLTSGTWRFGIVTSIILTLLAASLVLLTGYLGQISLASMAFAGTAGFALSKLTTNAHVPFPLSILISALIATAVGVVVGVPALRIRGAQLAVVTLAAAVTIQSLVLENPSFTPFSGDLIRNPSLFTWNLSIRSGTDLTTVRFSIMVLIVVAILLLGLMRLLGGAVGRSFLAVRSNERAAAAAGINVAATKLLGFALSAFLAGVGGCLIGYSRGQLSPASFAVLTGLVLLAMTYVGGITSIGGAIVAGLLGPLGVLYTFLTNTVDLGDYYQLIAAGGLLLAAIASPSGVVGAARAAWLHVFGSRGQPPPVSPSAGTQSVTLSKVSHAS